MINLKNDDDECFRWCHIRYLNPQEDHPYTIKKSDKRMVEELNYQGIEFAILLPSITEKSRSIIASMLMFLDMRKNNFFLFMFPHSIIRMF